MKRREVVLPRDWWATGLEGARGLWELFGRQPAHGCAVDIRPQAGGVRMRLHAQDFDALITAPIKGCIAHMEAHRRADGPEPWPLLYL